MMLFLSTFSCSWTNQMSWIPKYVALWKKKKTTLHDSETAKAVAPQQSGQTMFLTAVAMAFLASVGSSQHQAPPGVNPQHYQGQPPQQFAQQPHPGQFQGQPPQQFQGQMPPQQGQFQGGMPPPQQQQQFQQPQQFQGQVPVQHQVPVQQQQQGQVPTQQAQQPRGGGGHQQLQGQHAQQQVLHKDLSHEREWVVRTAKRKWNEV